MRVVLTSIDGCLLDAETNSYGAARQALAALERRSIPLLLISQRTRSEVELLRTQLELEHPFICEEGSVLYLPELYFPSSILDQSWISAPPYTMQVFGLPYECLRQILKEIRTQLQVDLLGYGDWTAAELAMALGVSLDEARRMQQREFSEVFGYSGDLNQLHAALQEHSRHLPNHRLNLHPLISPSQIAQWHLMGQRSSSEETGEMPAVDLVLECYRRHLGSVSALGIGNRQSDLGFLNRTQHSVLLPGLQSDPVMAEAKAGWQRGELPGPEGWNEVVLTWLEETDGGE